MPDALGNGPRSTADLAQAVGAHEGSLARVMRTLVSTGLFAEPQPGTYALTPVSDLLRTDAPASMRDFAVMITAQAHWQPWGQFTDTLRSGQSAAQHGSAPTSFPGSSSPRTRTSGTSSTRR